ncbi:MAG: hypothetical protein ACRDBL_00405 [Rhabdaerophilum sp.]
MSRVLAEGMPAGNRRIVDCFVLMPVALFIQEPKLAATDRGENAMMNRLARKHMASMVFAIMAAVFAVPATAQQSSMPQTKPKLSNSGVVQPASMMWVGNSFFYYNNSMHGHVTSLLRAATPGQAFRQSSVTIGGSGFGWHDMESLLRPNAIGSYSFVGDNEVRFNKLDKLFDLVMMMDCSQCPVHPQLASVFTSYAKSYSDTIRKNGGKPVFFMSWAYSDKPEMTLELAEAYIKAANDNDAYVIPAGLAFARSIAKRPDINLYVADKRHPSLAGTYLGAATVYAALFKASPVGLKYTAGLPPEVATHLQEMAWETVQAFYP